MKFWQAITRAETGQLLEIARCAEAPAPGANVVNLVIAGIVVVVLVYVHPWIAGVTITGLRPQ